MSPTEALSRLAAAGRIRSAWLPGMRWIAYDGAQAGRIVAVHDGFAPDFGTYLPPGADPVPDIADPATTGCLLALLREAMRDPSVYLAPNAESEIRPDGTSPLWFAYTGRGKGPIGVGPTEHAAIMAALVSVAGRIA